MGRIEIWGNIVPNLLAMAGRAIKEVSEHIPLSGFRLSDRVVFGLTKAVAELLPRADSVVFGLTKAVAELLPRADSVVFGDTTLQSEDLQGNLAESVIITNV